MSRVLDAMVGVIGAITDEFAGPPSVSELMEVIGRALPRSDNRLDFIPSGIVTVPPNGEPKQPATSRVAELNDNAFVLSANLIALILDTHAGVSCRLTTASLSKLLTELISQVPDGLLEESATTAPAITVLGSPVRQHPKVGDLVAIPAADSGCYQAVILARNRFGTAFGFFKGRHELASIANLESDIHPYPVYSGEELIREGQWRIVGHDDSLRSLFPQDPEIYHFMGVAETADGTLRQVSDQELTLVGVTDGSYQQVYHSSYLEQLLKSGRFTG
jgi:hypothetical protein